jgi:hypothetical protein
MCDRSHRGPRKGGGPRKTPIAGVRPVSRDFWPCAKAKAAAFKPARNPDGTPNMNGAWNPATANGSQNIEDFPGDAFLNPQITLIVDPSDGKVPYLPQWANKRQDNWDHYIDPLGTCYLTGVPRQVFAPARHPDHPDAKHVRVRRRIRASVPDDSDRQQSAYR